MKDALTKWHGMVWEFRRQMTGYWPYRGTLRAARQVVSEMGEVLDALDRLEYGQDDRTRQYDPEKLDVLDELADVAMMTLTAMGERAPLDEWAEQWEWEEEQWGGRHYSTLYEDLDEIDALVMLVKDFFACAAVPHPSPVSLAGFGGLVVWRISEYAGMDLTLRLQRRFDRIFRKHHPDGQRLARLEVERNGGFEWACPTCGMEQVPYPGGLGRAPDGIAYQNETPGEYVVADFAGYHPE